MGVVGLVDFLELEWAQYHLCEFFRLALVCFSAEFHVLHIETVPVAGHKVEVACEDGVVYMVVVGVF